MGDGPVPADSFTGAELERLGAFRLALEGRAPLHPRLVVGLEMGLEREDLPAGQERPRFTLGTRLEQRFR
jgi:hypothetical protein